jgi:hypothetical protein
VSLTENQGVFAVVHEGSINDLLRAFFKARPRYLTYATPSLAPTSGSLAATTIALEGTSDAMEYAVSISIQTAAVEDLRSHWIPGNSVSGLREFHDARWE